MPTTRNVRRLAASCVLLGLFVAVALIAPWTRGDAVPAEAATPSSAPSTQVVEWVPEYVTALRRAATPDEDRVGATTPASDTRLVQRIGGENVYIGSVTEANALCISVETPANQQIGTGCGGDQAIRSGQLFMGRGSEEEARRLYAGVVPPGIDTVRLVGDWGHVDTPVSGGIYLARTVSLVKEIQLIDDAGDRTQVLEIPRRD